MYSKTKILSFLFAVCLLASPFIYSQSFTFSGPSTVTIAYGQSTAAATFNFSYYNFQGCQEPFLDRS